MVENTAPTRQQLERIAQGDYRLLTALERLFEQSEEAGDFDDIAALFSQSAQASFAGEAQNTANDAFMLSVLSGVTAIAKQALETAARAEAMASSAKAREVTEAFPSLKAPEKACDCYPFFQAPIASGASNTFTAGSGEVITVENGVIKSIV